VVERCGTVGGDESEGEGGRTSSRCGGDCGGYREVDVRMDGEERAREARAARAVEREARGGAAFNEVGSIWRSWGAEREEDGSLHREERRR